MELLNKVQQAFAAHYQQSAELAFRAPGRVNLIGEHTDYNDGFVLPCAINYDTIVVARRRDDNVVRVLALDYQNQQDEFTLQQPIAHHSEYQWANYVRGVANSLLQKGYALRGCDLAISGNVPQGVGLSSSASLEVALGLAYSTIAGAELSPKDNALNGQHAENLFVGCNCGIMDQLISAEGQQGHAVLIDCRSLQSQAVSLPENMAVMIINSNVKRGLVGSEYNTRRQQCEQAAAVFGVPALRDVSWQQFLAGESKLDPVVAKRARHVISENDRTELAATAMNAGDIAKISQLMAESHRSMKDDFEITVPAIDTLVEILSAELGQRGGVRMTGGGFGGCVVALVPEGDVAHLTALVNQQYPAKTGLNADIFVCTPSQGAEQIAL